MSYRLVDRSEFKDANLRNWRENSEFWLKGRMRHLDDVGDIVRDHVLGLANRTTDCTVMDMGCGDAWLLRRIREKSLVINYLGLDFNAIFVRANARRYEADARAVFAEVDFERPIPEGFLGSADVVVNCFNFFELPDLRGGFAFASSALRSGGTLLVVTIDPIMQMLAITETREELNELLYSYFDSGERIAYDKEIDVGGERSGRVYKGIMYSASDLVSAARNTQISLVDYQEVVRTARHPPQIYQILEFKKEPLR